MCLSGRSECLDCGKWEFALLAGGEVTWRALTTGVFVRAVPAVFAAVTHVRPGDARAIAAPELQLLVAGGERMTWSTRKHKHHVQQVDRLKASWLDNDVFILDREGNSGGTFRLKQIKLRLPTTDLPHHFTFTLFQRLNCKILLLFKHKRSALV